MLWWYHWARNADGSVLSHIQMAMKQGWQWELGLTAVLSPDVMLNKINEDDIMLCKQIREL